MYILVTKANYRFVANNISAIYAPKYHTLGHFTNS